MGLGPAELKPGQCPRLARGGGLCLFQGSWNVPCVWCWLLPKPKHCSPNWCVSRGPPQRSVGLRKARPSKSCSRCPEALRTRPAHSQALPLWTQLVLCGPGAYELHLSSAWIRQMGPASGRFMAKCFFSFLSLLASFQDWGRVQWVALDSRVWGLRIAAPVCLAKSYAI